MGHVNFLRGVPADEALVPVAKALSAAYAQVLEEYGNKILQYQTKGLTDFLGYNGLKQTLAKRLKFHGDPVKQVICSNGGQETFSFVLKSLPANSNVATDAMTYDRVLQDIVKYGHQAVGVMMSDDGIDIDQLEQTLKNNDIKVYYQVGYHHNPTGLTIALENMEAASALCAKYNVLHVLDIAYLELRYDGITNQIVDLSKYPDTSAIVGSFTKTLSPGAKCGFGFFPEKTVQALLPVISNTRLNPNYPTQAAINQLFENGFYDSNLDYLKNLYKPRMDITNQLLAKYLPQVTVPVLTGGFFVGLWMKGIADQKAFIDKVDEKGATIAKSQVAPANISDRLIEKYQGAFFRLTFPAYTPEEIEAGIKSIADAYNEIIG